MLARKNLRYFIQYNHVAISCVFDVADVLSIVVFIATNAMTSQVITRLMMQQILGTLSI